MRLTHPILKLRYASMLAIAAVAIALTGCNMQLNLPPVTINIPIATDQQFSIIPQKNGDKVTLDFPETCSLPTEAQVEQRVEDVLGQISGLLQIQKITIDDITYTASSGNFDFIDTFGFAFTSGDTVLGLNADLSGSSDITEFMLLPEDGTELNLLDILPENVGDCVGASVTYDGAILFDPVVYNAVMQVTIQAVANL